MRYFIASILLVSMIVWTGHSLAQEKEAKKLPYAIADTGQDRCYGVGKEIEFPKEGEPFYGQDAQYECNPPSYRDNGDGTVTDLNTGLMWQKTPESKKFSQDDAEKYAKGLKLAGHSDWRLPTIKELFSIADFRGNMHTRTPYIDTKFFDFEYPKATQGEGGRPGERDMDAQYASSTRYLGITMGRDSSAFGFNFADGRIKSYPLHATRYVRCVRGNTDYGKNKFRDNGDGTVTDEATGLTWQKEDSKKTMDWKDALAYAGKLKLAEHDDWRLPSVKELQSIVNYDRAPDATERSNREPAIDKVFKLTKDESWFWTGTTHIENGGAYYVCFGQAMSARKMGGKQINAHGAGAVRSDPKEGDPKDWPDGLGPQADEIRINNYVRCVRGGKVKLVKEGPKVEEENAKKEVSRFIRRLDRDGDGRISRQEFDGPPRAFDRQDRNGDGYLDEDEALERPGRDGGRREPPVRAPQKIEGELEVITVGTGGPSYSPERSRPAALIKYGENLILVDMGDGTARHLAEESVKYNSIAAYCFTHHHRDHNEDAASILPQAWSREIVSPVIGPKGTKKLVEFLRDFYMQDLEYRLGNKGTGFKELPAPEVHELTVKEPLTIADIRISFAEVPHSITTFAYRFEAGDKSIVISGDLSYSDNLIKLAKDCDILVIDSGGVIFEGDDPAKIRRAERPGGAKETRAHSPVNEVAQMAAEANAKKLVLTHFGQGEVDEKATREIISRTYSGEIIFAEDMQSHR